MQSDSAKTQKPRTATLSKKKMLKRLRSLENVRRSWNAHWESISRNMSPRLSRFFLTDTNRGEEKHNDLLSNVALLSYRILAQGMMSGMTSPARPWFKLIIKDDDLIASQEVKEWLDAVTKKMQSVFQDSNTYRALHNMYEELALFGTAASFITQDEDTVIHHYPLTIGEYWLSANHKGRIDTMYRKISKTAYELVDEFGLESVSDSARRAYETDEMDMRFNVVHAIEPNPSRDASKIDVENMRWRSVYFEEVGADDKFLRVSGFHNFPVLCPRWAVTGNDVYGSSPGMDALGDTRQLDAMNEAYHKAVAYGVSPPIALPSSLKNEDLDLTPEGVNFVDLADWGHLGAPLKVGPLDLSHLAQQIPIVESRIRAAFYADMFLMISGNNDTAMTATEVAERREEKMMMLGPVVERLQSELLNPLIEITFDYMAQAGILPDLPEELEGQDYKVELVGMMAQSQQAIEANTLNRYISSIAGVANVRPDILDKINVDAFADEMARSHGISPHIILPQEEVDELRAQRAQAQQAAQQAEMQNKEADTADKMSKADERSVMIKKMM